MKFFFGLTYVFAALQLAPVSGETCNVNSDCSLNSDPLCSADCVNGKCIGVCQGTKVQQCLDPAIDCPAPKDPLCSYGCNHGECQMFCQSAPLPPVLPKPDPIVPIDKPQCVDPAKDCPASKDKYCWYGCYDDKCQMVCQGAPLPPILPKPDPIVPIDKPQCVDPAKDCPVSKDKYCFYDCLDNKCQLACLSVPQPPILLAPPVDPKDDGKCKSGKDCKTGEYCAGGKCLAAGKCSRPVDCLNPANDFPSPTCDGFFRCNQGECVRKCTRLSCHVTRPPVKTCDADPCDPKNCNKPFASCVPSKCGGCNAKFFNAAGKRICHKGNTSKKQTCSKSSECADGQFCAQGTCILEGTCIRKADCGNADNVVPKNTCAKDSKKDRLICKQNQCEWKC